MFRFLSRGRVGKRPRAGIGKFTRDTLQPESLEPRTMLNASSAGPEFQVNTFTQGQQGSPAVAMNGNGDSVVVWQSVFDNSENPQDLPGIYGQRYDSVGNAVGGNFRISQSTDFDTIDPAVEMDEAGNFIVAWNRGTLNDTGNLQDGDMYVRRFNSAGEALGDEFLVNTGNTSGRQASQGNYTAMDSAGNFIVSWLDFGVEPSRLLLQRFNSAGEPIGNAINVPPVEQSYSQMQVAMDDTGGFAVTWGGQSQVDGAIQRDLRAQFFNADGTAVGPAIDVSSEDLSAESFDLDIARDAQGNTTIVWLAPRLEMSTEFRIVARQFDPNGAPLGVEFLVSEATIGSENGTLFDYDIRMAMNDIGEFVVSWRHPNDFLLTRAFNQGPFGEPVVLRMNIPSTDIRQEHSIAMNDIGDYVITWGSGSVSSQDVFARRMLDDTLSTIGGFDRDTGLWYLRNQSFAGSPDFEAFSYGGPGWQPVVGDWNGDGQDTIGVVSPLGEWYLRNTNGSGSPDIPAFGYGRYDWIPVTGDWDGDGIDTVGTYNRDSGSWYLRNSNTPGSPDVFPFKFGGPNLVPVVGDWNDDGRDSVGVYDIKTGTWYLNDSTTNGNPSVTPFQFGGPGFTPVVGDWDDNGTDTVGVVAPDGTWYIRNSNTSGLPDISPFPYGHSKFAPVAGDWDARSSLLLAAGTSDLAATAPPITNEQLQPLVNEAIVRWAAIDVDAAPLLAGVDVRLADLNPGELGRTLGHTIWIDRDAAGQGWFVDLTPADDEEFTSTLAQGLLGAEDGPVGGRYDLLSVVAHELGHVLGLDHSHSDGEYGHVMGPSLATGVRTMPAADAVDRILREG